MTAYPAICLHVQTPRDFAIGPPRSKGLFTLCAVVILLGLLVAGCATAPLDQAGSLRSYDSLKPSNGLLTRSLLNVSKDDVLAAKTVRIIPTEFSAPAARTPFTPHSAGWSPMRSTEPCASGSGSVL